MNRPECNCFDDNPRLQAICNGTADLSLDKINAYRAKWGLSALVAEEHRPEGRVIRKPDTPSRDMQERLSRIATLHESNSGPSVFVAATNATPESGAARRSCCGGGNTSKPVTLTAGPGTELVRIWSGKGYPECDDCRRLAAKMNQWGVAGCNEHIAAIVEDILPRAKQWLAEERPWMLWAAQLVTRLGLIDADDEIRDHIRHDVRHAIDAAAEKQNRRVPRGNGPINTSMQDVITNSAWNSESYPELLELGRDLLSRTAIVVKSFRRHDALLRFVQSVRKFYPALPIHVADDSFTHAEPTSNALVNKIKAVDGVHWHQMPFDSGLPAGRNLAVRNATEAEFIIVCDDDFVFEEKTNLAAMLIPLDQCGLDLCGGPVRMDGNRAESWVGRFQFRETARGRILVMERPAWNVETCHGIRFARCDVTHNFFAGRRSMLLELPWDERYKISAEHLDSFLSWKQAGKSVAITIDCVVSHQQSGSKTYQKSRKRQFMDVLMQKWDIAKRQTIGPTYFPGV